MNNPPAPKVRRRGSLAASDTNGPICQSGAASAGGVSFSTWPAAKKCTIVHGTVVNCTFCRSAQHRPNVRNVGSTWVNFGQQNPNFLPSWTHLGATSPQVEAHTASKWGTYEIIETRFFCGRPTLTPSALVSLVGPSSFGWA